MATSIRRLFKVIDFDRDIQRSLVLSDSDLISVDGRRSYLTLRQLQDGIGGVGYPLDADIYAETATMSPGELEGWVQLQVLHVSPKDEDGDQVTLVQLRLTDGTTHKFWDGFAWVAAGASDWNTINDVSVNLPAWMDPALGLVINLSTTDKRFTPVVTQIKLVYDVDLPSFLEDWVYRSVIAQMKDELDAVTDYVIEAPGGTTITLSSFPLEGEWDITGAEGVWDYTSDPGRDINLLASFAPGVLTLSSAIPSGNKAWLRLVYRPLIAVTTSQDYTELDASPSVLFESIDVIDLGEAPASDHVMDVFADPPAAVILPAPRRAHINFTLTVTAPTAVDLMRLQEAVTKFLQQHRTLEAHATGDKATLRITSGFASTVLPTLNDLQTASMSFRLENMYMWHRSAQNAGDLPGEGFGVQALLIGMETGTGSEDTTVEDS